MDAQRTDRRLHLLLTFARLPTSDPFAERLARMLELLLNFSACQGGMLITYDEQDAQLEILISEGGLSTIPGELHRQIRHILQEQHSTALSAAEIDGQIPSEDWLCLPLYRHNGRPIGVACLQHPTRSSVLEPTDLAVLQVCANQIAEVIEYQRLFSERDTLMQNLSASQQHLREILGQLLQTQEEERRRIAYDIHDGLAQMAASAYQHLQNVASRYHPRDPQVRLDLDQALQLMRRTVKEARSLMAGLRPTVLDDLGLVVALRLELEQLRTAGWQVSFEEHAGMGRLPALIETALFRIAQEALNNVRKHAGSTRVAISLQRNRQSVRMVIRDWGHGYHPPTIRGVRGERMGVISMQERALLLGGDCQITGQPGQGTTVTVNIPLVVPPSPTNPTGAYE